MRHRYECQLRWADLDQLRHVNNVLYADYLQEARIDFLRILQMRVSAGPDEVPDHEPSGLVVVRHEMTYLSPLHFGPAPVSVEMWVSDLGRASFTLGCEIFHEDPESPDRHRTVYLRARTRIAPFVFGSARPRRLGEVERTALAAYLEPGEPTTVPRPAAARRTGDGHYPVHVRFSDLDPYQHVNNVKYLEYFQEGRVLLNSRMWRDLPAGTPRSSLVVAQADYDYLRPLVSRPGGYDLWTWVERVGTRSVVMGSEIHDGELVMARGRVVLVFFDSEADRSIEPDPAYRTPLTAALEAPDDPGVVPARG